jgi:4-azaleucine resistance transporter AzlC
VSSRSSSLPTSLADRLGLQGVAAALPVAIGYMPIAFAFGVLALKTGISPINIVLMSILVYAGSSQLIAIGLVAGGATGWSIILTTFVVNLRHLLLSAAMSPYFQRWRKSELAAFAYELTDETFALHSIRFRENPVRGKAETLVLNATAHLSWVLGTILGVFAGQLIPDVKPYGLDFALPAMFIALLVMQIRGGIFMAVAIAGGGLSLVLSLAGVSQWNVIIATLVAATLGVLLEQWTQKQSS